MRCSYAAIVARSSASMTSTRVSFDTTTMVVVTTDAMIPQAAASVATSISINDVVAADDGAGGNL